MSKFEQDLKDKERRDRFESACAAAYESYLQAVNNNANEVRIGALYESYLRAERAYENYRDVES